MTNEKIRSDDLQGDLTVEVSSPEMQTIDGRTIHGIQPTPSFPSLTVTAELPAQPDIDLSVLPFRWRLEIAFVDEVRNDLVRYPDPEQWESTAGAGWQPTSPSIAGGDLVIFAEADLADGSTVTGQTSAGANQILGINPDHDVVRNSVAQGEVYQAVLWRETRFTQFRDGSGVSNSYVSGMHGPIKGIDPGGTIGYGLGQLTSPPPDIRDLWDWTWNVVDSVSWLNNLRGDAATYAKQVQEGLPWDDHTGGTPPDPGVAYPDAPDFTDEQLDLEMLARYNGRYRYHNYDPATQSWVRRLAPGADTGTSLPYADAVKQVADDVIAGNPPKGW